MSTQNHLANGSPRAKPGNPHPGDLRAHQSRLLPSPSGFHFTLCQAGLFSGEATWRHSCNLPASGVSHSL